MASGWESIERQTPQTRESHREATDFLQEISNMLDSREFGWCVETLEGIYGTVEKTLYVSPGQKNAVNNIRKGRGLDPL